MALPAVTVGALGFFAFMGVIAVAFGIGAAVGSVATVLLGESKLYCCELSR